MFSGFVLVCALGCVGTRREGTGEFMEICLSDMSRILTLEMGAPTEV